MARIMFPSTGNTILQKISVLLRLETATFPAILGDIWLPVTPECNLSRMVELMELSNLPFVDW